MRLLQKADRGHVLACVAWRLGDNQGQDPIELRFAVLAEQHQHFILRMFPNPVNVFCGCWLKISILL